MRWRVRGSMSFFCNDTATTEIYTLSLHDALPISYDQIPLTEKDRERARLFLENIAIHRTFQEAIQREAPLAATQIVEPRIFNEKMWDAFDAADVAQKDKDDEKAKEYFKEAIYWAEKTVSNPKWIELAKKDNIKKEKEFGGIIAYPWGTTYPDNDHPLHIVIWRYPLLNEVGAAMWGLAVANFELENYDESKYWIERIIDEVPLHQIADVIKEPDDDEDDAEGNTENSAKDNVKDDIDDLIQGYWNALISWEVNPGGSEDRKSTRLNSSHIPLSRMPSSA